MEILGELSARYPNDVEAMLALAEAHGQQGDLDAAVADLERAVELDPSHPRAWFELARCTILRGDSRRAIDDYLVRAMVIQNRVGSRQGRADVVNAQGVAHHELGELEQAAERFAQAAELRRQIGDDRGYATSLRNLASIETTRGRYDDARGHLTQALALLERIGDRAGVADLYQRARLPRRGGGALRRRAGALPGARCRSAATSAISWPSPRASTTSATPTSSRVSTTMPGSTGSRRSTSIGPTATAPA